MTPLSMGFPRQEYWSGLPFPPPGDLEPTSLGPLVLPVDSLSTGPSGKLFIFFSVGMEVFDELLLMFPEFRSSLMFSGFGLKPPASGFQFYFYSSL